MSSEFTVLREAWLALDAPSEEVREGARARLFEEIASEGSERLGQPTDQRVGQGRLRRRSRLALVVVLGLLLVLIWATLTLAFGWHVIFGSTPKVPHNSQIYEEFDHFDFGAPAGMASGVIPNETRRVATYDGIPLWVAPTRVGGYCFVMGDSGGCDREGTVPLSVIYRTSGPSGAGSPEEGLAYMRALHGSVNPRWADSVEVRFEDGTVVRPPIVWISKPISQGFFYTAIGDDHRRAGHRLRDVVALDADGNLVAEDSSMTQGQQPSDSPPAGALVDEAEQVASIETPTGEAVLWRAPSHFDSSCTWLAFAGRVYGGECRFSGYPPMAHVVLVRRGSELLLVSGVGLPSSGSLTLGFADGRQLRLTANDDDGNLLRLVPAELRASGTPTTFSAVDASGRKFPFAVEVPDEPRHKDSSRGQGG
jgi:hypothetical protein